MYREESITQYIPESNNAKEYVNMLIAIVTQEKHTGFGLLLLILWRKL